MTHAAQPPHGSRLLEGAGTDGQGARLVARTLFREMRRSGFSHREVLALADELLGCLCATVRCGAGAGAPADSRKSEPLGE